MLCKKDYLLKSKQVPEVTKTRIIEDVGVGGIKLVYKVRTFYYKEIKIFGYLIPLPWPCRIDFGTFIVLRPYKVRWDTERNRLPRNYWGKKDNPLTNMWIEVEYDYDNIDKDLVYYKDMITDHELIKYFKKHTDEFSVVVNKSNINP